jgi:hypothetical protein
MKTIAILMLFSESGWFTTTASHWEYGRFANLASCEQARAAVHGTEGKNYRWICFENVVAEK